MNKILGIILFYLLSNATVEAQLVIGSTDISKLDIEYIELIGHNRSSSEASVWIDYGQGVFYNKATEFLKPVKNRESVRFTTLVEALNYVCKNGWELVSVYVPGPNDSYHYVLRRKK